MTDSKPQVRTAVLEALELILPETGLESLLPHIAESLKPEGQINLRKDLLTWLGPKLDAAKVTKDGVLLLAKPLIICLNDRNGGKQTTKTKNSKF